MHTLNLYLILNTSRNILLILQLQLMKKNEMKNQHSDDCLWASSINLLRISLLFCGSGSPLHSSSSISNGYSGRLNCPMLGLVCRTLEAVF